MTVVAWDGTTLAADKRVTYQGLACTVTKIFRVGDKLVGFSGNGDQAMEMLAWFREGADFRTFPQSQRSKEDWVATLVINADGSAMDFERTPFPYPLEDRFLAIGSGRDYALAAMHLGKTAREAVEIACLFDAGCGNGVDELKLKTEGKTA